MGRFCSVSLIRFETPMQIPLQMQLRIFKIVHYFSNYKKQHGPLKKIECN